MVISAYEDHLELVNQIRGLLDEGKVVKATDLILSALPQLPEDPTVLLLWAKVCEEAKLKKYTKMLYGKAIGIYENLYVAYKPLAKLLLEAGYLEDAINFLVKFLKVNPNDKEAKELLASIYRRKGYEKLARELLGEEPQSGKLRSFPAEISNEELNIYFNLFRGSEKKYGIQRLNVKESKVEEEYIEGPLTPEVIKRHIQGEVTAVLYPIRTDNTCSILCHSIFFKQRSISDTRSMKSYQDYMREKALGALNKLLSYLNSQNVPSYIEQYPTRGFRHWIFVSEFVHFLKLKNISKWVINRLSPELPDFDIEPASLTEGVGIGWQERGLTLPLGVEPMSGERLFFIDSGGRPFKEQIAFMKKIRKIPFKALSEAIEEKKKPVYVDRSKAFPPNISLLLKKCKVVNHLVKNFMAGYSANYDEKIILLYTIGLLDTQGNILHSIFEKLPDYDFNKLERIRERLKPNPISCVRIREIVPQLTSYYGCNCIFDLSDGRYPSPVMHVSKTLVPVSDSITIEQAGLKALCREYLRIKTQMDKIQEIANKLLEQIGKKLNREQLDQYKFGDYVFECDQIDKSKVRVYQE